jgi:xylulokinase
VCNSIRLVGGGSRSFVWRQIVSDVLQMPLHVPREADSAALGAALQAAAVHQGCEIRAFVSEQEIGMDHVSIEPDESTKDLYQAALERHRDFGSSLFGQGGCP